MAAVAHPLQSGLGAEAAAPAELAADALDHQLGAHQPIGRLQGRAGRQRQLELRGAVFRVELLPGQGGGIEGIEQGCGVVEPLHQPIGAVGPARQRRQRRGRRVGAWAGGHQPLQLETGLQLQPNLLQTLLLLAAEAALIAGIGSISQTIPALTRGPGPAAGRLQGRHGRRIEPQAQVAVGAGEAMAGGDHAIGAEGIRHRREAHPLGGGGIKGRQRHHLHQAGAGMVDPGDRQAAHPLIGQGGSHRGKARGHGADTATIPA